MGCNKEEVDFFVFEKSDLCINWERKLTKIARLNIIIYIINKVSSSNEKPFLSRLTKSEKYIF